MECAERFYEHFFDEAKFEVKIVEIIGTYFAGVSKKKKNVLHPTGEGADRGRNWMGRGRERSGVGRSGVGVLSSV